eukprot:gene10111-10991_t
MSAVGRKRGLEAVVENTSSSQAPKVAKTTNSTVFRKNIVKLAQDEPEEFKRFLIALSRMQRNAERDPKNDWWNICAIHGGPFRYEVESSMRPAYEHYLEYYGSKDSTAILDWQASGFCAHNIPTFLVWHRPYMKAFELALQHYDPKPDSPTPLALHYWEWDSASSRALPKIFTDKTIKDYSDNDIDNPLLLGPTGITTLTNPPYTQRGKYPGVPLAQLDSGYRAFHTVSDYSKVCTANNNHYNFESPHNQLHNMVGGDMSDVSVAAFDPIFWLHHSNVERMHCAWIRKHGIPTDVTGFFRGESNHSFLHAPLYPFPPKAEFGYNALPWKVDNTKRTAWSTVDQWLKEIADYGGGGDLLDYYYDNLTDVCVPNASLPTLLTLEETSYTSTKTSALERMFIYLDDVQVSGSGTLYVEVTITAGGRETKALLEKPVFSNQKSSCPNCAANTVSYSWIVYISQAVLGAEEAVTVSKGNKGKERRLLLFNVPASEDQKTLRLSSSARTQISATAWFVKLDINGNSIDGVDVEFSNVELRADEREATDKRVRGDLQLFHASVLQV